MEDIKNSFFFFFFYDFCLKIILQKQNILDLNMVVLDQICIKLISKMWVLNNLRGNLLGYKGQSATSQLFWLADPSLNNSCWVFPCRGDLCSFQELAPNGTQTFPHLITVIKFVIKWCNNYILRTIQVNPNDIVFWGWDFFQQSLFKSL